MDVFGNGNKNALICVKLKQKWSNGIFSFVFSKNSFVNANKWCLNKHIMITAQDKNWGRHFLDAIGYIRLNKRGGFSKVFIGLKTDDF
jgi:hypothetical protein